jgi:hypothetical protein
MMKKPQDTSRFNLSRIAIENPAITIYLLSYLCWQVSPLFFN